jgi:hypothetical protein
MITSPVYGGAYCYGETEHLLRYEGGQTSRQTRRKPREQWLALIPEAHEGYVSWNEFERIQELGRANNNGGERPGTEARPRLALWPVAMTVVSSQYDTPGTGMMCCAILLIGMAGPW